MGSIDTPLHVYASTHAHTYIIYICTNSEHSNIRYNTVVRMK